MIKLSKIFPPICAKQKVLLPADVIASIALGAVWPPMHALMNAELALHIGSSYGRLLSAEIVVCSISAMMFSSIWKKIQFKVLKSYLKLEVAETVILTAFCIWNLLYFHYLVYYLFDLFYSVLVGRMANKAYLSMKQFLLSDPQEKIDADNAMDFYRNFGYMIGCGLAMIDPLQLTIGSIYSQSDGIITINKLYLCICIVTLWLSDFIRTVSCVYTFCRKYQLTIWKAYFKSNPTG